MEGGDIIMVQYPDLSSLSNSSGISGLLQLPNSGYPYYWLLILSGIWLIIVLTFYFTEKDKTGKSNILSDMSVACLAIIMLSVVGTILKIVTIDIMIYILVFSMLVIGIWFFSGRD